MYLLLYCNVLFGKTDSSQKMATRKKHDCVVETTIMKELRVSCFFAAAHSQEFQFAINELFMSISFEKIESVERENVERCNDNEREKQKNAYKTNELKRIRNIQTK